MIRIKPLILSSFALFLVSCTNPEDEVIAIVDDFLTQINDPEVREKGIDYSVLTPNYAELFKANKYYLLNDWKLKGSRETDSTFVVEAVGKTSNALGMTFEHQKAFGLIEREGTWSIYNSYKLIADEIDFDVVDTQWDFTWDRQKSWILKEVQDSVKLTVKSKGRKSYFGNSVRGSLVLENNASVDLKGIKILIEHFDSRGKSVNTDDKTVYDIIRSKGYREFDWSTFDCSKCASQKFSIQYIKESH